MIGASEKTAQAQSQRAWLGVEMSKVSSGKGVTINHVVRTSPAEKAGLRDGDVILSVDGKDVAAASEVIGAVSLKRPGDAIDVKYSRGGNDTKAQVTLGVFPDPSDIVRLEMVGVFAPSLTGVQSVQGSAALDLQKHKGKVVLLDFWAGWCGVCRATTPTVNGWYTKYQSQGLVVLGITSDAPGVAAKAASGFGIQYTVGSDSNNNIFKSYHVSAMPTLFVIDKKGVIREVSVGLDPAAAKKVETAIQDALAQP